MFFRCLRHPSPRQQEAEVLMSQWRRSSKMAVQTFGRFCTSLGRRSDKSQADCSEHVWFLVGFCLCCSVVPLRVSIQIWCSWKKCPAFAQVVCLKILTEYATEVKKVCKELSKSNDHAPIYTPAPCNRNVIPRDPRRPAELTRRPDAGDISWLSNAMVNSVQSICLDLPRSASILGSRRGR